jgi:hypothetical protein
MIILITGNTGAAVSRSVAAALNASAHNADYVVVSINAIVRKRSGTDAIKRLLRHLRHRITSLAIGNGAGDAVFTHLCGIRFPELRYLDLSHIDCKLLISQQFFPRLCELTIRYPLHHHNAVETDHDPSSSSTIHVTIVE